MNKIAKMIIILLLIFSSLSASAFDAGTIRQELLDDRKTISTWKNSLSQALLDYRSGDLSASELAELAQTIISNKVLLERNNERLNELFDVLDRDYSYENYRLLNSAQGLMYSTFALFRAASSAKMVSVSSSSEEESLHLAIADVYLQFTNVYDFVSNM